MDAELVRFTPTIHTRYQAPLMPICLDSSETNVPENLDIISYGTTAEQTRPEDIHLKTSNALEALFLTLTHLKSPKEQRQKVSVGIVDCKPHEDGTLPIHSFCTQGQVQTLPGDSGGSLVYTRHGGNRRIFSCF